jgi:hypothetical protein
MRRARRRRWRAGQSARCGNDSRPSAAISAKAVSADRMARPAASQSGLPASRPIFIAGQVSPNSTTAAASCSQAIRETLFMVLRTPSLALPLRGRVGWG